MQQLMLFNPLHQRENNALSESHLEQHKDKFTLSCLNVLKKLVAGERLTVKGAMMSGLSGHLPRRIKDLKDYGIPISDVFVNGVKEYFMTEENRIEALKVMVNKIQQAA